MHSRAIVSWPALVLGLCAVWTLATAADKPASELSIPLPGLDARFTQLDMVLLPAGSFNMGAAAHERGRLPHEGPRHAVTISRPFYIGRYEVTQAQWEAVMGSNPAYHSGDGDRPIEMVSWQDIQVFIERLNQLGQGYFRLPTEAEWEYACRAGTTTRFSFGDALTCPDTARDCTGADPCMWYYGNNTLDDYGDDLEYSGTKEVGQKEPNPWGLFDMHGNVWEWCSDWYGLYAAGTQTDPQGPQIGTTRVLRGGMWNSPPNLCRSSYRAVTYPEFRHIGMGFRLVRTTEPPEGMPPPPTVPQALPAITLDLPNLEAGAVPLEMVLIPSGSFGMGAANDERGAYDDERPRHDVAIPHAFYMGRHEVTQAQWNAVMGNNPAAFVGPNRPVETVTWHDANTFIGKLNRLGLGTFRLPTEAEWEYACRAGATTRYSFGDALDCMDAGGDECPLMDSVAWWQGNAVPALGTRHVGLKQPNGWGLYDMHGNVGEWVDDWYGPYSDEVQEDPRGPAAGSLKIVRGGMYHSNARYLRSAFRDHIWPTFLCSRIGLRLVRLP